MSRATAPARHLLLGAVALAIATGGGCSWVKSKFTTDTRYEQSRQNRPLEAPPGLDLPRNSASLQIPAVAGSASGVATDGSVPVAASATAVSDFTVADSQESTWRRLGIALDRVEGVTITSRAQLLNSYEVSYQGTTMLVRVEANGDASRVSAVGTDGQPLVSAAATELLGQLRARLN